MIKNMILLVCQKEMPFVNRKYNALDYAPLFLQNLLLIPKGKL